MDEVDAALDESNQALVAKLLKVYIGLRSTVTPVLEMMWVIDCTHNSIGSCDMVQTFARYGYTMYELWVDSFIGWLHRASVVVMKTPTLWQVRVFCSMHVHRQTQKLMRSKTA